MSSDSGELRAVAEHRAWQRQRYAQVTSPVGNLALVAYQPVGPEPDEIEGFPGTIRLAPGRAGALVRPTGTGLALQVAPGVAPIPVTEETFVARLSADGLPLLRFEGRSADVFSLDGSDYELRIYDVNSRKLVDFRTVDTYPYDPAWRLPGTLVSYTESEQVPWEFTRVSDSGHTKTVPGALHVVIAGREREFTLFSDGGRLVLVFADGTTATESYRPGRFLGLNPPSSVDGSVTVDFNYAIVPPCGFSDFYSCPIPPMQNRVEVPVRAGERIAVFSSPPSPGHV
jgi:uncharacterized protein (DUF1684 family)